MALEDYMEPEVGVAVAVTAAVASPQVRHVLRRGAVYGLAGLLMAGDAVSMLAQGVKRGVQKAVPEAAEPAVPEASEASVPEILSADGQVSSVKAPVVASKYSSVAADESATPPVETEEAAPVTQKRTRKTAEATDNE